MIRLLAIAVAVFSMVGCQNNKPGVKQVNWKIAILPASVRLDPSTNKIIENRIQYAGTDQSGSEDLLKKNWVYDGEKAKIIGARGEYVSFQLALSVDNSTDSVFNEISIEMPSFRKGDAQLKNKPEFFLEWSVKVNTPSTGYAKASLGTGWYPDALIPFHNIQADSSKVEGRWIYPLWLPDFNNRIDNQKTLLIWVDQFIPFKEEEAAPGKYITSIAVTIGEQMQQIPVELEVWNFAIPNENQFKASMQEEGFLSGMDEKQELQVYQLFKRNRMALMDPTYKPDLKVDEASNVIIEWGAFDNRLAKYFTGEAFTEKYGYKDGPGYAEPIETFMLPFDVYGKHGTAGWPDIGKPEVEKDAANQRKYITAIAKVRNHLLSLIDAKKTDLTVYLNGLDESYFQQALERMVFYGNLFQEHYPEAIFRIDGAYTDEQMDFVHKSINAWGSHTINYNIGKVRKYQAMGIKDWLYGPLIYEGKVNSWVGSSTFIDLPLINQRAISWACWKYHTYSWLSWGIGFGWKSAWYDPETWKDVYKEGADSDSTFTYKKLNGNALLIYSPGIIPNVNEPCPSIRLKATRDGVQDYEYMRLLNTLDKKGDNADSIVNSIIHQPFGESAIGDINVWEYGAEQWDKSRIKLGEMINKLMAKQ